MNWKTMKLVLAVTGAALGIACIEDGYDPWRPAAMSPRAQRPSSEFPPDATVNSDFPFDAAPSSRR